MDYTTKNGGNHLIALDSQKFRKLQTQTVPNGALYSHAILQFLQILHEQTNFAINFSGSQ